MKIINFKQKNDMKKTVIPKSIDEAIDFIYKSLQKHDIDYIKRAFW